MKKKMIISELFAVLFIVLAILLKQVDVAEIGPNSSKIGLAAINGFVFGYFGVNGLWDKITDVLLGGALLVVLLVGILGGYQLVKQKSLMKVDKELLSIGGLYVVMAILYVFFEKIANINCRPVFEDDGTLETSFPSTHTLVSCVVLWSAVVVSAKYINNEILCRIFRVVAIIASLVISMGRVFAGKHWITDVVGGYFLSLSLVFAFCAVLEFWLSGDKKNKR